MGRASWVLPAVALAAAACAPKSEHLIPPLPPAGTQTRILTIVHDAVTDVRVEDASQELVLEISVVGAGDPAVDQGVHLPASVEIAYFAESPADLRLTLGPQTLPGEGKGRLVNAAPLGSWRSQLSDRLGNSWAELPWSQLASSRIRLEQSTPCLRFDARVFPLANNMDLP